MEFSKFEVGKTYETCSIVDSAFVYKFTVLKRTARTVTITDGTDTMTRRVSEYSLKERDAEIIFPYGVYSMCPVLEAKGGYVK